MVLFDSKSGYLPIGIHRMSLEQFNGAFAWTMRRRLLLKGFMLAARELERVGCREIIVDGSFVSSKDEPGDWDGAYDPTGVDLASLDPILRKYDDGRRAMRAKYFGDVFPMDAPATSTSVYIDFFQSDREGNGKGVVSIPLKVTT